MPVCFGSVCYLAPAETPALSGLRVLRAGLELGELRRDRFSPAHALALWLHTYPQTADFPAGGRRLPPICAGETLHGTQRGWTLLTAGGLSLGWVRGADGVLKNQYPKGLRPSALTASLAFSPPISGFPFTECSNYAILDSRKNFPTE